MNQETLVAWDRRQNQRRGGRSYVWIVLLACGVSNSVCQVCAADPPVTALAFAPDGAAVVVGSQAGLFVHDWPELSRQQQLSTALTNIHDVAFSPDGHSLAVAGGMPAESGQVEVFAWPQGTLKHTCDGLEDCVQAVAWLNDASLATASLDHQVLLWDLTSPQPRQRFVGHSRGVSAICSLPTQNVLVSGGLDQSLRVWDAGSGELKRTLNNHTREVHGLAVRPQAGGLPMIASVAEDRTVRLWQPTIGRMVRFCQIDSPPLAVAWLNDGTRVAVASADGHVRIIDPDTVEITADLRPLEGWVYSLAVHPTDGSLLVGGRHGELRRVVP